MLDLPTAQQLKEAALDFDASWGGVDEVLYGICRRYPDHRDGRQVTAKVALIDRAYSAGLERQVIPDEGAQAITKIAAHLLACGSEIDAVLAALALQEPLSSDSMAQIVAAHGRFVDLLRRIPTRGTVPRFFAAKYMHFHCPVVPIYDSYAAAGLIRLVPWKMVEEPFAQPDGADTEYWSFCVRFFNLYEACRDAGLAASVKSLDAYLWAVPGAK